MNDVELGREQITVAANDTLDRVLEALRATTSNAVILAVDERSPLLISLQQLHTLDEVAQAQGVQVAIASTNRKLLNAARVFGLEVVDVHEQPLLESTSSPQLLAGQPLGRLDLQRHGDPEFAPIAPEPQQQARVNLTPPPATADDLTELESADELPEALLTTTPPTDEDQQEARLDPYGQPYDPDEAAQDDLAADDGWDEPQAYDPEQEEYDQQPPRGLAGYWHDVRAWIEARRSRKAQADYDDEQDAILEPDEDGWDEPPYQLRQAAKPIIADHATTDEDEDEPAATPYQPVVLPFTPRNGRSRPPQSEQTARLPVITSAIAYEHDLDEDEPELEEGDERWQPAPHRAGTRHFAIGSLLFTLLILGSIVAVILYLLVPTATVTLAARTGQVTTDFRVVVAEIDPSSPEGQPTNARIIVPAKRLIVPVNGAATRPATGARLEPDLTAGGVVILTNPSTAAATVPNGTRLEATDGRIYVTTEEVTVAAADPFGAGAFGSAPVNVAATIRGSGGNAPIGVVRGQLASGIYYTNKTVPIAGGSDRRISTISAQDRAAAQAAAEEAARAKGQAAFNGAVPAGSTVMHDTHGVGNFKVQFSAAEGTDGDNVTATITAEATGLVYQPAEVEAQARDEATKRLNSAAKPGESVVAGTVQINTPQLVEDLPGQLTYSITGGAQTRAVLGTEADRDRLAQDLAHKDDDEARAILAALPGVASSTIQYQTGPFPMRMPWLSSHIQVQITEAR